MAASGPTAAHPLQPPLPVLYSFRRCPYAMRARLALAASGLVCEGSAAAALLGELEYEVRASVTLTFGGGTNEIQRELIAQFYDEKIAEMASSNYLVE